MKLRSTILLLLVIQQAFGQKIDTIWYNNKWEKTKQVDARHYFRVIEKLGPAKYLIKDFYETGKKQMEGISMGRNVDVKNGSFIYWYRSGKKQMEAVYENDKAIQLCRYTEQGEITEEWERVPITVMKDSKLVTEYRVLQRSPRFPGGKTALDDFIKKNVDYFNASKAKGVVILRFAIDTNGNAIKPEIVQSLSAEHDQWAIDLIKKMPKWEPGLQDKQPIVVTQSLPISFN